LKAVTALEMVSAKEIALACEALAMETELEEME
jgi:hypothetical protein